MQHKLSQALFVEKTRKISGEEMSKLWSAVKDIKPQYANDIDVVMIKKTEKFKDYKNGKKITKKIEDIVLKDKKSKECYDVFGNYNRYTAYGIIEAFKNLVTKIDNKIATKMNNKNLVENMHQIKPYTFDARKV